MQRILKRRRELAGAAIALIAWLEVYGGLALAFAPPAAPAAYLTAPAAASLADYNSWASSWAGPYIAYDLVKGIAAGYPDGYFHPNRPLTRAQFAVLLDKAALLGTYPDQDLAAVSAYQWQQAGLSPTAVSLPSTDWYAAAVEALAARGILHSTVGLDQPITRLQAATWVGRLVRYQVYFRNDNYPPFVSQFVLAHDPLHPLDEVPPPGFADYSSTDPHYRSVWDAAVNWIVRGLPPATDSSHPYLDPGGVLTRAQGATLVYLFRAEMEAGPLP